MSKRIPNCTLLLFLVLIAIIAISFQITDAIDNHHLTNDASNKYTFFKSVSKETINSEREKRSPQSTKRTTRRPGFLRTLFSVIYEQWNDTRNTIGYINNLVNDNFLPENAPRVQSTTSGDVNASTTEAPYKITRSEFLRILQRNLRGIARLYNLEMRDAIRESNKNWAQYRKNASLEVSKWL